MAGETVVVSVDEEESVLGYASAMPTNDYDKVRHAVEKFGDGFDQVVDNLHHGGESTKLAVQFVERWYKMELAHVKSMDDLLGSKPANLIPSRSMFGNNEKINTSVEPVAEVRQSWSSFISELQEVNAERRRVAEAVRDTIWTKLSKFSEQLNQRQDNLIGEARKVLGSAKSNVVDLIDKEKRFKKLCRAAAEDVLLVAPAYEPEQKKDIMLVLQTSTKKTVKDSRIRATPILDPASMTPPQKRKMGTVVAELVSPSVQKILQNFRNEASKFHRAVTLVKAQSAVTYSEFVPKIMQTLHGVELQRISYMKHCMGHITTGLIGTAKKSTFTRSRQNLDKIIPSAIMSCVITEPLPPPPEFIEPDWDEILTRTMNNMEDDEEDEDTGDTSSSRSSSMASVLSGGSRHLRTSSLDQSALSRLSYNDLKSKPVQSSPEPKFNEAGSASKGTVRGWFSKIKNSPELRRKRFGNSKSSTPEPERKPFVTTPRMAITPEPRRKGNAQPAEPSQLSRTTGTTAQPSESALSPGTPVTSPSVRRSTDCSKLSYPGNPPIFADIGQLSSPYFKLPPPKFLSPEKGQSRSRANSDPSAREKRKT